MECPICEDYSGSPQEVEAHISGMKDEAHTGHLGAHYRDQLGIEGADEVDVGVEEETAGIPVPVNSWLIVAGAVVVLLLVVVVSVDRPARADETPNRRGMA